MQQTQMPLQARVLLPAQAQSEISNTGSSALILQMVCAGKAAPRVASGLGLLPTQQAVGLRKLPADANQNLSSTRLSMSAKASVRQVALYALCPGPKMTPRCYNHRMLCADALTTPTAGTQLEIYY